MRFIFPILLLIVLISACGKSDTTNSANDTTSQDPIRSDFVDFDMVLSEASFEDYEGNTVQLSDFKGKFVMIDFWETWCTPCLKAFPSMSKAMLAYPNDFVVLAVNLGESDQDTDVSRFRNANSEYPFVWLKDSNTLANDLQVPGIPFKIFVTPDGNYLSHELGLSGSEDANYDKLIKLIESQLR